MDEVIKLVKTHRLTPALDQRLRLAEQIFQQIEPQLRFFVFGTLPHPAAQDVVQETLRAVTVMPDENTDAAAKLKKLGQRVRDGWVEAAHG